MPFGGGEKITPAWAQRQEELLSDCIVSPDVFNPMMDRLRTFVVPYQQALATEGRSTTARWACTWGTSLATTMCCSTSACPFPRTGHGMHHGVRHATCRRRCGITHGTISVWRCSTRGVIRCPTAG